MKRRAIRLGVAGTLAALSVAALGIPAQAAAEQPAKPGITVEAALPAVEAPAFVEISVAPGGPEIGMKLNISHGGGSFDKVRYQWLRNGVAIAGATGYSHKVGPADVGKKISYRATFSQAGRKSVIRTSNKSGTVLTSTPAPVVTGKPIPGSVLRGSQKTWAMTAPVTMKYQWLRDGVPIPGATTLSYKLKKADLNTSIVLRAQGTRSGKVIDSAYALPVIPSALKRLTVSPQHLDGDPRNPKWGPYTVGNAQAGDTLVLSKAVWKQQGVKSSIQWLRNGGAIPAATGTYYTLTARDVSKTVTAMITGSLKGYADTIVAADSFNQKVRAAPRAGSRPSITGKATVGSVLTATWKKNPKAALTWHRDFQPIPGATGATYRLTAADRGKLIAVSSMVQEPRKAFPTQMHSPAVVPR